MAENTREKSADTLRTLLNAEVRRRGSSVAISAKSGERYINFSRKTLRENAHSLGAALRADGYEGKNIVIAGENGYFWAMSYLAVTCYCGTALPLSRSLEPETFANIASDCGAPLAILGDECESIAAALKGKGIKTISFSDLDSLILRGSTEKPGHHQLSPDTVAELAVSSGTEGRIKIAELTHANLCFTLSQLSKMLPVGEAEVFYSVLPLTHCYERICGFLYPLCSGATVAYGEGLRHLSTNLRTVRPTVILCVPFVLDRIYSKIWQNIEKKGIGEKVRRVIKLTNAKGPLRMTVRRQIFAEIHDTLGGRLSLLMCGGSPADPDTISGLHDFGIRALQGYGMTESAALISVNRRDLHEYSSVGLQTPDSLIDIYNIQNDGIGEIRYRGGNIMKGYFDDPEATEKAVSGGWLYTGDMGYFDRRGFLHIVGRKSNIITTKKGKQIFPEELEAALCHSPFVKSVVVVGIPNTANDDYDIVAVIFPDEKNLSEIYGEYLSDEQVSAELTYAVRQANSDRDSSRRIRKFIIRHEDFPMNEDGKILRTGVAEEASLLAGKNV